MCFLTHPHLIQIQSSTYSVSSNLPLFSVGVLLVLCVASPRKSLSQGTFFGGCVFVYAFFLVITMLGAEGKFLIECLRAKTTRTKTPIQAIFFRVPMTCVSPYLSPHISAESLRMKTTKWPYFTKTLRRFIFRSRK